CSTSSRVWCVLASPTSTRGISGASDAWLTDVAMSPPRPASAAAVSSQTSRSRRRKRAEASETLMVCSPRGGTSARLTRFSQISGSDSAEPSYLTIRRDSTGSLFGTGHVEQIGTLRDTWNTFLRAPRRTGHVEQNGTHWDT